MTPEEGAGWLPYLVVPPVALVVSGLTLFSGFGLGTLLLPAFALFFPVPAAVAATAVVHVLNNLFKLSLLWRHAVPRLLVAFGIPAVAAAFPGALLLAALAGAPPWMAWEAAGRRFEVTPVGLTMGILILGFAALELVPGLRGARVTPRWLSLGGLLSGFFGGLSGHQGALRSAFLLPLGLPPASFAATQAALATMVDAARLAVYGAAVLGGEAGPFTAREQGGLLLAATLAAFAGAYAGTRLLPKITVRFVRAAAGALLLLVGAGLASGIL